jgi:Glycosyltransferase family 87
MLNTPKTLEEDLPSGTQRTRSLEVVLGLLPLVLGLQLLIWIVYLPVALRGDADFRNCYTAGMILRSGRRHQLYDYELQKNIQDAFISQSSNVLPYVHLPYEALIFAPLTVLSYRNAFFCFLGFNLLCLLVCYRMLRGKLGRLHALWRWFPFLFVVGFMPIAAALMQGQDSLITLVLLVSALVSLEAGNDGMAGFLVGLVMFKFQLVLPIAGLFLFWRRWRFVLGASFSIFITLALSALVAGIDGFWAYLLSLRNISTTFTAGGRVLYLMPVSRMPNLRGLIHAIPHLRSGLATALVLILSLVLFALAAWSGREASTQWQFAIAVSAAAVLGYHVLMHDLSILLIPMAMLLEQRVARGLWNISIVWLSTPLCFFAYDNVVALPVLGLFLFLVWRFWRTSENNTGASKEHSPRVKSQYSYGET